MSLILNRIMYDPISYIHSDRLSNSIALCSRASVKSLANDLIIRQFNLSTENFELNSALLFYINNWDLLPSICLLTGCHFYRDKFAERGLFYKIPHVIRRYYENSLVLLTDKRLHKSGPVNYNDIISFGFSVLLSFIRQQPLAIQQRFYLLFPKFVDGINTVFTVTPLLLKRIADYAKKNRNELIKISIKWDFN